MVKANPERGEVPLVVIRDGAEVEYVLVLSMAAARIQQKNLNKTIGMLIDGFGNSDAEAICELVFVLLQRHHRDEIKTVDQAAELIDEAGFKRTGEALSEVIVLNTPNPKRPATDTRTAPAERTGDDSTLTHAA